MRRQHLQLKELLFSWTETQRIQGKLETAVGWSERARHSDDRALDAGKPSEIATFVRIQQSAPCEKQRMPSAILLESQAMSLNLCPFNAIFCSGKEIRHMAVNLGSMEVVEGQPLGFQLDIHA
jgi:hypothetical protein